VTLGKGETKVFRVVIDDMDEITFQAQTVAGKVSNTLRLEGKEKPLKKDFESWTIPDEKLVTDQVYLISLTTKQDSGAVVDLFVTQRYKVIHLSDSVPVTLTFAPRELMKYLTMRLPDWQVNHRVSISMHTTSEFRPELFTRLVKNTFNDID
jgi:hypothetical protein